MPFSTFEFGLLFASMLIGYRMHRFSSPHTTFPFLFSYLLRGFRTSNHVPLSFGDSLLKGPVGQPPVTTIFPFTGSKRVQLKPRVSQGTGNLRGTCFCARVSSNLPRIENPR